MRRDRRDRTGQAIVLFALLFVFLAGVLGIALDGTRLYYEKRRAQAAADAGAIAGVQEMRRGRWDYSTQIRPAVVNDTGLHGYSENEATITVNQPPTGGPQAGDGNSLEVIVAKQVPTTLMRILGPRYSTVRARAVGGLQPAGNPWATTSMRAPMESPSLRNWSINASNSGTTDASAA